MIKENARLKTEIKGRNRSFEKLLDIAIRLIFFPRNYMNQVDFGLSVRQKVEREVLERRKRLEIVSHSFCKTKRLTHVRVFLK